MDASTERRRRPRSSAGHLQSVRILKRYARTAGVRAIAEQPPRSVFPRCASTTPAPETRRTSIPTRISWQSGPRRHRRRRRDPAIDRGHRGLASWASGWAPRSPCLRLLMPEIGSLILMAPVVSGRRYLRELHMIQVAGYLSTNASVFGEASARARHPPGCWLGAARRQRLYTFRRDGRSASQNRLDSRRVAAARRCPYHRRSGSSRRSRSPAESLSAPPIRVRYEQARSIRRRTDDRAASPRVPRI